MGPHGLRFRLALTHARAIDLRVDFARELERFSLPDKNRSSSPALKASGINDAASGTTKQLVGRLVHNHLRPQAGRFAIAVFCMIIVAAASATMLYLLKPVLDDILISQDRTLLYIIPAPARERPDGSRH